MISGRKVNKTKKLHYNLRRYIASGLAGIANIFQYIEKHNKEAHAFDGQTDDGLSLFAWCFVNNHYGLVKLLLLSACPIDAEYLNKFPEFAAKLVVQLLDTQGTSYDEAARRLLSCPKFNINIKYGDEPILFVAVKKASHATLQALLARRPLDPEVRAVNLLRYANLSEQKKLSPAEREEMASLEAVLEQKPLDVTMRSASNTVLTDHLTQIDDGRFAMLLSDPQIKKHMLNAVDSGKESLTPLAKAVWYFPNDERMHRKIDRLLDEPEIDVLAMNAHGETPLSMAAGRRNKDKLIHKMFVEHIIPKCQGGKLLWNDKRIIYALNMLFKAPLSQMMQQCLMENRCYLYIDMLTHAFIRGDQKSMDAIITDANFNPYLMIDDVDNYVTYALKQDESGELYNILRDLQQFEDATQYENTFVAAASAGKLQVASELSSQYSVYPNCLNAQGEGVLHCLAARDDYTNIKAFLYVDEVVEVNTPNGRGDTLLHVLIRNQIDITRYLGLSGLDLNAVNHANETPLNLAIELGNFAAALCLLNKHFAGMPVLNVNLADFQGNSPLAKLLLQPLPQSQPWDDVLLLLMKVKDLDVRQKNALQQTYLMMAAQHGLVDVIKSLLERCTDNVNDRDQAGETALMLAARAHDKVGIGDKLLAAGADSLAVNLQGRNALQLAVVKSHQSFINRLSIFATPPANGEFQQGVAPSAPRLNE